MDRDLLNVWAAPRENNSARSEQQDTFGLANPIEAIEFRMEHAGLSWKQVAARQSRILKSPQAIDSIGKWNG